MRKSVFGGVVPLLFVAACAANLSGGEDPPSGPVDPTDAAVDGSDARSATPTEAGADARLGNDGGSGGDPDASSPGDASTAADTSTPGDATVTDASSADAGDTTPPTISFRVSSANRLVAPALATLYDTSKIAGYEIFVDGISQGAVTLATPIDSVPLPLPAPLVDGTQVTFRTDARDVAGNQASATRTVTNTFDLTAPAVTLSLDPVTLPIPFYTTALVSVADDLSPVSTTVRLTVGGAPVTLSERLPNTTPGTRWFQARFIEASYAHNGVRAVRAEAIDVNGNVGSASTDIVTSFAPGWAGGNIGTAGTDYLEGIAVSPSDDVYILGSSDTAFHGAPIGTVDSVVEKRASAGAVEWGVRFGAAGETVFSKAIAADSRGVVVVGDTRAAFLGPADMAYSPFVVAYTNAGVERFATRLDAKPCGNCFGGAVQVDDSDGAIWVAASRFSGGQYLPTRLFRFDANGALLGTHDLPVGMAVRGMRYGAGRLAFVANNLAAGFTQTATGSDLGVVMLDRTGAELWRRQYASPVVGSRGAVTDLDFDASGNLYMATGVNGVTTTWVRKIDPSGNTLATFTITGTAPGRLAVQGAHFVHANDRVGRYSTLDGAPVWSYPLTSTNPRALAIDSQGGTYLGFWSSPNSPNINPFIGGNNDISVWKLGVTGMLE